MLSITKALFNYKEKTDFCAESKALGTFPPSEE